MKVRPILFSAPMVKAILSGAKTVTRRLVKPSPGEQSKWLTLAGINRSPKLTIARSQFDDPTSPLGAQMEHPKGGPLGWVRCPFGELGDRLWVRETCLPGYFQGLPFDDVSKCAYRADWSERAADLVKEPKWTPAIHMPRSCSRITLEITGVRVERLQDIGEEDARAEGIDPTTAIPARINGKAGLVHCFGPDAAKKAFALLWDGIYSNSAPWSSNPWVWVVDFKRVEQPKPLANNQREEAIS